MATLRDNFPQLLAPALARLILDETQELTEEYSQFCTVDTSTRAYEDDTEIVDFGKPQKKPEGTPLASDEPFQGPSQRYIMESYGLSWSITKEMLDDERYGIMKQMPSKLVKGCSDVWEQVAANVLNLGFSSQHSNDGVSFFNAAHPLINPGGGSYGNLLNASLSVTGIQEGILIGEHMVNNRGLKRQVSYDTLWIPFDLMFTAQEILGTKLMPYTGENTINSVYGTLKPVGLHFLTSSTAWFMSNSKSKEGPRFYWRMRPELDATDDFDTKGSKHSIMFRIAAGVSAWRDWIGSNPG